MFTFLSMMSISHSYVSRSLVTTTRVSVVISIAFIMFPSFVGSLARSRYFSILSLSFTLTQWSAAMIKVTR